MKNEDVFQEIYDFYEMPYWQTTWFKVVIVLGIIALIALIAYLFLGRNRKKFPPWEIALQQLKSLRIDQCVTKKDFKKVYFDITFSLKRYLNERYGWSIMDKTDEELIQYLEKNKFDEAIVESLKKLFYGSSLVKYADEVALKTQVEQDLITVISLITKTIPTE